MDYNINNLVKILDNLKHNPYGIKDREHVFDRSWREGHRRKQGNRIMML